MSNVIEFPQDYFFIEEVTDEVTGKPIWLFGRVIRNERRIIETFDNRRSAMWALATTEEEQA